MPGSPQRRPTPLDALTSSFRAADLAAQCRPSNVLIIAVGLIGITLAARHVPAIQLAVGLSSAVIPISLVMVAAAAAALAWWARDHSPRLTALLVLVSAAAYSHVCIGLSLLSDEPAAYVFAGMYLFMALHWGRFFALTSLAALAVAIAPLVTVVIADASLAVQTLALIGGVFFIWCAWSTRRRRRAAIDAVQGPGDPRSDPLVDRRQPTTADISIWQGYIEAHETAHTEYEDHPAALLFLAGAFAAIAAAGAHLPGIKEAVGIGGAFFWPLLAAIAAASCSLSRFAVRRRSPSLAGAFLLMETASFGAACMSLAVLSLPPAAYLFAALFVVLCFHWGRLNALTLPGLIMVTAAPSGIVLAAGADTTIRILLLIGVLVFVSVSWNTRQRSEERRRAARSGGVLRRLDALLLQSRQSARRELQLDVATTFHRLKNQLGPALWNLIAAESDDWRGRHSHAALDESLELVKQASATVEQFLQSLREGEPQTGDLWLPDVNMTLAIDRTYFERSGARL
ncbi:MAG: hypothetical protein JRI55_11485, partial [Deltaproteobacteria bacterium]|nr:hypothetical protein [Deltaproteobacteria bacterium]